jgi:serine protease AprX
MTRRPHPLRRTLLCFAALAGSTTPLLAGDDHELAVSHSKTGAVLRLDGRQIYSTAGVITNQRLLTYAGAPTVLAVWEEQQGAKRITRFALSLDGQRVSQVGTTENQVRLRYASFDPITGEPPVPAEFTANPENELYLVQFVTTPLEEMRREITAVGGTVHRFLTDNTHIVRMSPQARDAVAQLPSVRWVGAYHPAYRVDETIREAIVSGARIAAARYSIECLRPGMADQQRVADAITRMGGIIERFTPDQYRMEATLTREQLLEVLQLNEINFLDRWLGPGGHDMDLLRQMGGAVPLLSTAGFLGQGVRAEVFDTGVIPNHQQWNGQVPLTHNATAVDSHGNACYGIQFATGTGNAQATGFSPQREQGIFSYYNATSQFGGGPTRLTLNTEAIDPAGPYRSIYQTSSVGSPQITTYTTVSAEVDDYLFRADYLSFQSQSNTGNRNSRPQAWAKNIVAVGGLQLNETLTRSDDTWNTGASIGPAQDLRVKPDLSHSWNDIFTTYSTSTTGYGQFGGTSGATPTTAGHSGLLQQMWHQGIFPGHGGGASVFASRPKSTTAKALMINGAYRYTANATNRMYRGYVGWGMADLTPLYNGRNNLFIVNWGDPLTNAQTRTHTLLVQAGEPEFRVTMIYPDPQGSPAAAQQRINDLTLKVTDPLGTVYWGNNGMVPTAIAAPGQLVGANYSTAGGSANTYDTVENVFIQNPVGGNWTVEIIASQVVQDGYLLTPAVDAVYSLVASNVTLGPPPPTGACCLPSDPCTVMSQVNCTALNGTYRGDNVTCANANCPPIGACCFGNGTCSHMSSAACATGGGVYRGDGVNCNQGNCTGACCMADGTCNVSGPTTCTTAGGVYAGAGVTCAAANCPQPGACCFPDSSCSIQSQTQCAALNGVYRGNGSVCATANCPVPVGLYVYPGPAVPIQDGSAPLPTCGATAIAEIVVPDSFTITDIQTGVHVAISFQGDVRFRLSHGPTTVELVNRPGAGTVAPATPYGFSAANYGSGASPGGAMKFRDAGVRSYSLPAVAAPGLAGTVNATEVWKPLTGTLASFVGQNAQGVWRLQAEDCAAGITGTIQYFNVFLGGNTGGNCYANCDGSTAAPVLNVGDFTCFLQRFAAGESYANCDASTAPPVLNVGDFTCFLQRFAAGCP